MLSIVGLVSLLYGIIEAPQRGWTDSTILMAFFLGIALLGAFFAWESHTDHPMLDVKFFKNPRFTAASTGIMLIFFAMFGMTFLITQYFQFVLGYSPFATGIRFLPWAAVMMIVSPLSSRLVDRFGTKLVVTTGLTLATVGLVSLSTLTVDSHYWPDVILRMMIMAFGMSLTMAPATESIMSSLPLGKAGVGSAVNDTTRQVGGAMGVAIIGSVLSSIYASKIGDFLGGTSIKGTAATGIKESLGAAQAVAGQLSKTAPDLAAALTHAANSAYVDGMQIGILVAAGATLLGAIIAFLWLPARARQEDVAMQDAGRALSMENGQTPAPSPSAPPAPEPVPDPTSVEA